MSLDKWSSGLITPLLAITRGQWLNRNFIVHDPLSGIIAIGKKEELIGDRTSTGAGGFLI